MYYIGLDIGTTGCKAAVFDEKGACWGKSYREFDIICPQPVYAEQDPFIMWSNVVTVLKESVSQAFLKGAAKEEIIALSTSVLGEEVMPVDRDFVPLRNAILGMDYRARNETEELKEKAGELRIYEITGFVPHPMASLPTIMWMRSHQSEMIEKTYKYVTFTEYVMKRLGAEEGVIDDPQAGRMMAFDIVKKDWSDELLEAAGLSRDYFCRTAHPGTIVGHLSKEMAQELGLTTKTALVAGGQDQTCSAMGAGLVKDTVAMDSHGTIEGIGIVTDRKVTTEGSLRAGVSCYTHTIPDKYFLMSSSQVGGLLLKWYKNNFALAEILEAEKNGRNVYDVITDHAPKDPASVMVLPHFIGSGPPWNDLDSRGAIVGLTIDSTRHDIAKAIMDSLTYEFRINVEYYESIGFKFDEMRVVGGAANSPVWMQIKADILGREVSSLREREAACLGAAIIAMAGTGAYGSSQEAVAECVRTDRTYQPDMEMNARYEEKYQKYTHLYESLRDFNRIKA